MRYVTQLKKNLISVGSLGNLGESILKLFSGSLVVLKGIQHNNLYYLKDSAVIKNLSALEYFEGDSIRIWQMRLQHVGLDSLQALAK